MSPAAASVSSPSWKTVAASASDARSARALSVAIPDEIPQPLHRRGALAVRGEPLAEAARVGGRVRAVDAAQRQRGPHQPQPVGQREVPVAQQRTREVQRRRQAGAAQPRGRGARGVDGDVEPVLQPHLTGDAEPAQQAAVGGAAAQEDVLAVVDVQLAPLVRPGERGGEPAQPRAALEQHDAQTGVGAAQGRGDPGETAADHPDPQPAAGHAIRPIPASAFAATPAFCQPESDRRWW